MTGQRVKMVRLYPDTLGRLLRYTGRDVRLAKDGAIPADAKLVNSGHDVAANLIYLVYEHDSFDLVPAGARMPLSVPTITWHPSPEAAAGTPYADPPAAVVAMQPMWHPGPRTGDFRADLLAGMLSVNDVLAHLGHPAIPAADGGGARVWMPRQLDAKD